MSKYRLKATGTTAGATIFTSSMTMKAASTLPNSRMHRDRGRMATSMMLMGSITGDGFKNWPKPPLTPWTRKAAV